MLIPVYALLSLALIFKSGWILGLEKNWNSLLDQALDCKIIRRLKSVPFLRIVDALVIVFLMLICLHGTNVPDFRNYEAAYSKMSLGLPYSYLGAGWYLLMNLGLTFSLSYAQVRALLALAGMLVLSSTYDYYSTGSKQAAAGKLLFWGLYMIFPVLLDFTQIRFFTACAFVVYGFRWLDRCSLKNVCLYIVFVLLGALVHTSVLIYLLLLFVHVFRRYPKTISVLSIAAALCGVLFKSQLIALASRIIRSDRLERYFLSGVPVKTAGLLFLLFFSLSVCLVLFRAGVLIKKRAFGAEKRGNADLKKPSAAGVCDGVQTALGVNVLMFGLIALARLDANFFRLERPGWMLFLLAVCGLGPNFLLWKNAAKKKPSGLSLRLVLFLLALLANLYFISAFTFPVILGYLG